MALLLLPAAIAAALHTLHAPAGVATLSGAAPARQVVVVVGGYSASFTEATAWTVHEVEARLPQPPHAQQQAFSKWITPTGFMGSVMSLGSNDTCCPGSCCHWNGTGHGGERILNVTLLVDGRGHAVVGGGGGAPRPPAVDVDTDAVAVPAVAVTPRAGAHDEPENLGAPVVGGGAHDPEATGNDGAWVRCGKIFGCPAVGLVEGGAGPAECEAKCAALPNCSAFNVRMSAQGGCSLRDCATGTAPSGELAGFAGYASYAVNCSGYAPTPPPPPPVAFSGSVFSLVKWSRIGPLLSRQNYTVTAAGGVTQSFDYTVVDDTHDVDFLYSFMTMWNKPTSKWVAGTSVQAAPEYRGTFAHNDSFTLHEDILFCILVDPSTAIGSLYRYPQLYATRKHAGNFFWNRAYDNKLYMQVAVPASGSFGYTMHLEAFGRATEDDFEAQGLALGGNGFLPPDQCFQSDAAA